MLFPHPTIGHIFIALVVALSSAAVLKLWTLGRRERDLPPGPLTVPVFGNALQFPSEFPHLQFARWAREYGEIYSIKILNRTIIVVSSPAAVKQLLDKEGAVTGNRPRSHLVQRVTSGLMMALEDMSSNVWKHGRKAIHTFLTPEALEGYLPTQQAEYVQFLYDVLNTPQNLFTHIRRTTVSIMLTLLYGKRCPQFENSVAEVYFDGVKLFNEIMDPGAHPPVDLFPSLKYLPSRWASWKSLCDRARVLRDELYSSLLSACEQALNDGHGTGCYIETVLKNQRKVNMTRDEIRGLGAALMDAGAETTASFFQSFVLALLTNPCYQRRAQDEIDRVVGSDRLPLLDDFDHLPYLQALVKEVHRFRPVFPVGVPHANPEDITYKGYHIPKDSTIFMNIYGIFSDPDLFDEPESFKPERYLESAFGTKAKADASEFRHNFPFGAGRRICPGENMAWRTIALSTMNFLWAFECTKDTSGTGGIDIDSYAKPGLELAPRPFTCKVKVRDERRAAIIRESFAREFPSS